MDLNRLSAGLWENVYHVGFLVPDIKVAMRDLAEQLGVTFEAPYVVPVNLRYTGSELTPGSVRVTFARQGPPYLELLEAAAGSYWSPEGGARVHHLGVWVGDFAGELARLGRLGFRREVSGGIGGNPESFAYLVNDFGMRLELVADRGRESFEQRRRAERG